MVIEFVKKTSKSHDGWIKKNNLVFNTIPIYTMTMVARTNWKVDLDMLFENIPIVPYTLIKKKRGRKSTKVVNTVNDDITIGSVICVIYKNKQRGTKLTKPDTGTNNYKYFRNSLTLVLKIGDDKFINIKLSEKGTIQMTGVKNMLQSISCIDYIWKYIISLSSTMSTIYTLKNEEIVPRCIIVIVMSNITYNIGFNIDREKLGLFINDCPGFLSIYEPSFRYAGVNIKHEAEDYVDKRMVALYWKTDGNIIVTKALYSCYLELFTDKDKNKELSTTRYHSWMVFQSGSIIQSGPNYEKMGEYFGKFVRTLKSNRKYIEEHIITM